MAIKKTSIHPGLIAHGVETVPAAGSLNIPSPFGKRPIKAALVTPAAADAAAANNGVTITHKLNADGSVTIYAWKNTAAATTTLIAATVAVDVNVTLFG